MQCGITFGECKPKFCAACLLIRIETAAWNRGHPYLFYKIFCKLCIAHIACKFAGIGKYVVCPFRQHTVESCFSQGIKKDMAFAVICLCKFAVIRFRKTKCSYGSMLQGRRCPDS